MKEKLEIPVNFLINNELYQVHKLSLDVISRALEYLNLESANKDQMTVKEILLFLGDLPNLCKSLSVFICGDESLADELSHGTIDEVITGLEQSISLIKISSAIRPVMMAKGVCFIAAKPK